MVAIHTYYLNWSLTMQFNTIQDCLDFFNLKAAGVSVQASPAMHEVEILSEPGWTSVKKAVVFEGLYGDVFIHCWGNPQFPKFVDGAIEAKAVGETLTPEVRRLLKQFAEKRVLPAELLAAIGEYRSSLESIHCGHVIFDDIYPEAIATSSEMLELLA